MWSVGGMNRSVPPIGSGDLLFSIRHRRSYPHPHRTSGAISTEVGLSAAEVECDCVWKCGMAAEQLPWREVLNPGRGFAYGLLADSAPALGTQLQRLVGVHRMVPFNDGAPVFPSARRLPAVYTVGGRGNGGSLGSPLLAVVQAWASEPCGAPCYRLGRERRSTWKVSTWWNRRRSAPAMSGGAPRLRW